MPLSKEKMREYQQARRAKAKGVPEPDPKPEPQPKRRATALRGTGTSTAESEAQTSDLIRRLPVGYVQSILDKVSTKGKAQ